MCGINGFNFKDTALIQKMNQTLKHRGPDGEGLFVVDGLSLGHVRLSILDLSERGKQPMSNGAENIWITYNGEIYNFKEIKDELIARGIQFKSDTDTEVILYAYQEYGVSAFEKFNGIFAFCLYDKLKDTLFLVRDRLGIKPLYYYFDDTHFIFSSEIKPFLNHQTLKFTLDKWIIQEYLQSNNISSQSMYLEIKKVRPGQILQFDLKNKILKTYAFCPLISLIHESKYKRFIKQTDLEIVDSLDQLLNEVIRDQLISDAPLGTICSGGLDSSLIAAIACRYKKDMKLFNVKVAHAESDESKYARQVAEYLKLDLIEEVLDQEKFLYYYKQCIDFENLPLMHANSVGIYLVSKKAKKHGFSVLLSGEGADELFGGYHRYKTFKKKILINQFPLIREAFMHGHLLWRDEDLIGCTNEDKIYISQNIKNKPWLQRRFDLSKDFYEAYSFIKNTQDRHVKSFMAKDLQYYLLAILRRTDRMSMAAGLEMRVPYLDNRLIDFGLNLPVRYQISFDDLKIILKKVAERYLPFEIVHRSKKGFPIPIQDWLGVKDHRRLFLESWHEKTNTKQSAEHGSNLKDKIKILHVVNSLDMGGLEKFVIDLAEVLQQHGHTCVIACLEPGGELSALAKKKNLNVVTFNRKEGSDWSLVFALTKYMKNEHFDIVHTHNPGPVIYGTLAATLAGCRNLISTRHGRERKIVNPLIWALNKKIVSISHDARTELFKWNWVNKKKVSVIHNGIDLEHYGQRLSDEEKQQLKKSIGLKSGTLILGNVGRLAEEKDQVTLIRALGRLIQRKIKTELVIVGDGYLRKELESLAQKLGVTDSIKFLGFRNDIEKLLNIFDIFILSSNTEGISLTLLEAMAMGRPVIATSVGGNPEVVVDNESGFLVASGSPEEIEEAVMKFYKNPQLIEQIGIGAKKRATEHFGLPEMVVAYENMYQVLLDNQ